MVRNFYLRRLAGALVQRVPEMRQAVAQEWPRVPISDHGGARIAERKAALARARALHRRRIGEEEVHGGDERVVRWILRLEARPHVWWRCRVPHKVLGEDGETEVTVFVGLWSSLPNHTCLAERLDAMARSEGLGHLVSVFGCSDEALPGYIAACRDACTFEDRSSLASAYRENG